MSRKVNTKELMSEYKFIKDYSQWRDEDSRYETWEESVARVMDMHRTKYSDKIKKNPALDGYLRYAQERYEEKRVLASQRNLQFGGEPTLRKEGRTYNCLTSYCDRPRFFQETMWWLLLGGGVGFSVQKHHVAELPKIESRSDETALYVIPDSIEGWSDAFGVLLSSYFVGGGVYTEFKNKKVLFDFGKIRPEGALISGGFKAPGPDGLRDSLQKAEAVIERCLAQGFDKLRPIDAYDIIMHMSDAVLSGGLRRSATIAVFSPDDKEMREAKTGDWFVSNPQRGRSNNSALLVRSETSRELYTELFDSIKQYGEPGIVWTDSTEFLFNPCVEIGFMPVSPNGKSAWQGCNLCEINGGAAKNKQQFLESVEAAAIIGTLQAGYTNFEYCDEETKATFEKEALLGISITGWMENPDLLFDEELLKEAALLAKEVNEKIAEMIDINPAARLTCTKPSGNASVLLGTASGIHPHHSKRYFRNVQGNINEDVVKVFTDVNPEAVEPSVWNPNGKDVVISFPIEAPKGSKFKDELMGTKLLDYVKLAQNSWVEYGTVEERGNHPMLRHNISNTITVDDWDEVEEYVWENKDHFAGISFLSPAGDKDYAQAPFTEVKTDEQVIEEYGVASMFASGLVVDGLNAFGNDLWLACDLLLGKNPDLEANLKHATSQNALQRDWVRRAKQFARRYFKRDIKTMTYCLKDVYLLHKWETVTRTMKQVDWQSADLEPKFTAVDTTAGLACSGGVCEIVF